MIISYEVYTEYFKIINSKLIELVVWDEAHNLKNSSSKRSISTSRIRAARRVVITGTPIQNTFDEFFHLLNLACPSYLDQDDFYAEYSWPIKGLLKPGITKEMKNEYEAKLQDLHARINAVMLHRTVMEHGTGMPAKHVNIVFCRMQLAQLEIYSRLCKEESLKTFTKIHLLEKVCAHPLLAKKQFAKNQQVLAPINQHLDNVQDSADGSGKFRVLASLLKSFNGIREKVVVVSKYTEVLKRIQQHCKAEKYDCSLYDGSLSNTARQNVVDTFNDPSNTIFHVLLLSMKAGGCGLNLIGAWRLVMFDADWNPANDDQAMARVWRLSQTKECHIYR